MRDLVHGIKFAGQRRLALDAARLIHAGWRPAKVSAGSLMVVTWAPTSTARRIERGFDQAELIARHLGVLLGLSTRALLRRTSESHQTGASRSQRLVGPSFVARPVRGVHIVVVDDVVTTGATLNAARQALLLAGAVRVDCVAVARTPDARVNEAVAVPGPMAAGSRIRARG